VELGVPGCFEAQEPVANAANSQSHAPNRPSSGKPDEVLNMAARHYLLATAPLSIAIAD